MNTVAKGDTRLTREFYEHDVGLTPAAAEALVDYRDAHQSDDVAIPSIAVLDAIPHTNIPFFEALIRYNNRNVVGHHGRSACTRPHDAPPPDVFFASPGDIVLTWELAVPFRGMKVNDVGITIRNKTGVAGTILAAVVYASNNTDPVDELRRGDVFASTLISVPVPTVPDELLSVTGSFGNVDLAGLNVGDPADGHDPFPHALVFATGVMGATLPSFEIPAWQLADCADVHSFVEAFPEDADSMPLEEAPEMFLDSTDDCD